MPIARDGTREILEEYSSMLRVVEDEGKGIGAARNLGFRESKGDFIFFVDADCFVEPNHFRKLLNAFDERTGIVWTSGLLYRLPPKREFKLMNAHLEAYSVIEESRSEGESLMASTALFAVRRDVFEEVGGFWEYPYSCEDMDFSYRVLKAGYRIKKIRTRSVSLPRTNLMDMIKQQVWYGMGAAFIYHKYMKIRDFWEVHGWGILSKLPPPLNYVAFIMGALISLFVAIPTILLFSPSLTLKKRRIVRLSPLATLLFDVVDRASYTAGLLKGMLEIRRYQ